MTFEKLSPDKLKQFSSTAYAIKSQQTRAYAVRIVTSAVLTLVCVLLGFYLVLKGTSGEFQFEGGKMFLKSLAPGLFFVLGGVCIMLVALFRRPFFRTDGGSGDKRGYTETRG